MFEACSAKKTHMTLLTWTGVSRKSARHALRLGKSSNLTAKIGPELLRSSVRYRRESWIEQYGGWFPATPCLDPIVFQIGRW